MYEIPLHCPNSTVSVARSAKGTISVSPSWFSNQNQPMMPLALRATNAVDVGQCRAVSYTSSDGVVPQNMLDLVWLDVVIKNIDTKALYVPLPISEEILNLEKNGRNGGMFRHIPFLSFGSMCNWCVRCFLPIARRWKKCVYLVLFGGYLHPCRLRIRQISIFYLNFCYI